MFGRWKDTYFDLFADQAPALQEFAVHFDHYHAEECCILQAVNKIGITCGNLNEIFDKNLFNALDNSFDNGSRRCIDSFILRCLANCVGCKRMNALRSFIISKDMSVSPNCNVCRSDDDDIYSIPMVFYLFDVDLITSIYRRHHPF